MDQENKVLCGASAYEQKYYFNREFASLTLVYSYGIGKLKLFEH